MRRASARASEPAGSVVQATAGGLDGGGDDRLPARPARQRRPTGHLRRRRGGLAVTTTAAATTRWGPTRTAVAAPRGRLRHRRPSSASARDRRAVRPLPLHAVGCARASPGCRSSSRRRGGRWRSRPARRPMPPSAGGRRVVGRIVVGAAALDGVGPLPRPADDGRGVLALVAPAGATAASRCRTTPAGSSPALAVMAVLEVAAAGRRARSGARRRVRGDGRDGDHRLRRLLRRPARRRRSAARRCCRSLQCAVGAGARG